MTLHDPLTGLGNRLMLTDRLPQLLARRERHGGTVAVLMCDLDHFKAINDSYGHPAGDQLLIEVASRVREVVRPEDTVARFGGDEFVIMCDELPSAAAAMQLAQRVLAAAQRPVLTAGHVLAPTISIGVATVPLSPGVSGEVASGPEVGASGPEVGASGPEVGASGPEAVTSGPPAIDAADTLLADADLALLAAKEAGRGRVALFSPRMREQVIGRLQLLGELPAALVDAELEVFYQPVVDLEDHTMVGAEALIRWRHPSRGLLQPDAFLPSAADSDLMISLDAYVINRACVDVMSLSGNLGRQLEVWTNLSARTIAHPGLGDLIREVLHVSGCPPESLILEVAETALVQNLTATTQALHRIRDHGVRLAIDDFGTGHSVLSYLTVLPIHAVKLDRMFVTRLDSDPVSQVIVQAITALGRVLDLITLAEGVETPAQLRAVVRHGCHRGQGFLFGEPVDFTHFAELAASGNPLA